MVLTPYLPTSNVFFRNFTSTHTITPGPELPPSSAEKKAEPIVVPAPAEPAQAEEAAETGIGGAWLKCIPVLGGAYNVTHGVLNLSQAAVAASKRQWSLAGLRATQGAVRIGAGVFNILTYGGAALTFHAVHHASLESFLPSLGATLTSERQMLNFEKKIRHVEALASAGRRDEARAEARKAEKEVLGSIADDVPGLGHGLQGASTIGQGVKFLRRFRRGKESGLTATDRDAGREIHN